MQLSKAALYSFLTTCYGGCFYFAIGTFMTLAQHGDMAKFLADFIISMIVCFVFLTFIFNEINSAFEQLNKRPEAGKDAEKDSAKKSTDL
ncbi:MAG: hypothetical protein K2X27_00275 [Candidatus Obscuribacterales bacterium]|nr:hypothetical protein [Candidatus Obscuribacterales bacterium]